MAWKFSDCTKKVIFCLGSNILQVDCTMSIEPRIYSYTVLEDAHPYAFKLKAVCYGLYSETNNFNHMQVY